MSLRRRKKSLTKEFTVFMLDYSTGETKEMGRFYDLAEAIKLATKESSKQLVGFVYGKDSRVLFSTL
jgi:hypothetical protein